ncbi:MAG TPA: GPW/gp25 family protein [Hymenobacter sp.]|uniref:GPW/gp25 family protein n=1 Tax=Hymenobacter sp. TaxID=1898978 RepID=UPI002D801159|nr:GPW/gp25 family protein [Hymenobacter sp.]HET9505725.1 GPW/gp25 family protein [Hymenobacter sp.]
MPLEDSYLGQGWSFPPSFELPSPATGAAVGSRSPGGVQLVVGLTDIEQSLCILLSTRLGERILAPDYGCDLTTLLFEPLNAATETRVHHLIHTAVLYHEPRIELLGVTATQPDDQPGLLLLDLAYQVRNTNSRYNYVYPFYLQEGSDLSLAAGDSALGA